MERPQAAYSRPAGGKFDLKQFLQLIRHASLVIGNSGWAWH